GFFIAMISARAVAVVLYFFAIPFWQKFQVSKIQISTFKTILIFSVPLIPNMIGWWINNLSDRYIIKYLMGTDANGIYAVAAKFPSIISIFSTILISSWMITALQNDERKNTDMFRAMSLIFSSIMVIISLLVIIVLPYLFSIYIQSDAYASAEQFIPILLLAGVLSAISSLFGVTYLGEKDTKMAAITTITSGVINVALNFILIPMMGIMGAVWATFASFIVIVAMRYVYVRKRTSLDIPVSTLLILTLLPTAYILNMKQLIDGNIVFFLVILSFVGAIISVVHNSIKYKLVNKFLSK
ncbi:MAG: polysaccharide biosynthesis C-terminal domain-containing protein, partial [Candidatus Paceibacterota bacterium]